MPAVPAVPVTPTMPDTHDTHDTHDTPTARGFAPLSPLLFFTPPEPFVYTSSPTHYVLNHAIVPNLPVFFSSAAPAQFSALPALPAGLQLLNGAIRGTPREARAMMEYTVTAYDAASKTTLQATVRFDVVAVTPPSHILVTDEHGSPVTSLTVTMYAAVNLTLSADVPVFAWSVSSDLPEGLAFLPSQQRVVGHVLKKLASSTFWITCSNDGGSVSAPFSIHVVACNYDHLVYSTLNEGAVMEVQVQTEAGKVVINKVMDEPLYALVLCLPLMPYRLHALCKRAGTDCILHITREDDLILSSLVLLQGQKAEASLALNYSTAPVITTQTPIIYTQSDAAVNVWFTVENPFYKVVFQPALPPTLAFNQSTLLLSGTFATPGIFTYQLRAANEVGEGVLLVTVYVDHCPQNTSLVQLQRRSSLFGESLTILRGSEPLYHFRFQVGPYADMLCIPFGDFTVRMENEAGRGWVSGSDLIVTDDEDHLWGTFRLDPSQRVQEDVLHYALLASNATALRFLVTALAPVTAWLTPQFDDSAWALGAAGAWGTLPAGLATTYFRATVAMERDATFLQLSLFLKEGAIVYVDGAELARENLPAGQIYHATTASASFPTARWVAYSVEATHALERYTVVAVELHRQHVSSTAPISFAMNIHSHHVPSLLRSAAGNLTSSDAFNATHPVANAFDGCGYTAWDAPLPAWARLRYDDGEKRVVNRVDLRIADSRSWTAPSFVRLYGERGGRERLLGEWRGGLWFNAPHATVSLFAHNTAAFAAYRVEFPAVPGKEALQLTAVAFYQALVLECAAVDGWPAVAAGQTLFRECGKVAGFMARRCVRRGATAAWEQVDRSGCVSVTPSIGKVYLDAVLAVLNCTLAEWQEGVGEAVHRVMRRELRLRGEQVKLPSCAETVMQSTFAVRSLVRVEGEKSDKATLVEEWHRLLPEITRLVQEEMGELARGMAFAFEEEPLVRQCYTVLWIVLGCIAGLGVIVCVCAIAYRRWRQKHIVQFSKRTL